MVPKPELIKYFCIAQSGIQRNLAYSEVGDKDSDQILICIPGVLETRDTFIPLLQSIQKSSTCRAVSVDLCGRGGSDPLLYSDVYSMKLYLSDLELFLNHIKDTHHTKPVKIHLLGTSMGGILAMYLAAGSHNAVSSVILNDVGLSLAWWSIYKLYGSMGHGALKSVSSFDVNQIADTLNVNPAVVKAVQDPAHFDLPFKSDLMGMRFQNVIHDFKGPICLIHAKESVICTAIQVDEFLKSYPESNLLEVPNAVHPAPYNDFVCDFVISKISKARSPADSLTKVKVKSKPSDELVSTNQEVTDIVVQQRSQLQQAPGLGPDAQSVQANSEIKGFQEQLPIFVPVVTELEGVTKPPENETGFGPENAPENATELLPELVPELTTDLHALTDQAGQHQPPTIAVPITAMHPEVDQSRLEQQSQYPFQKTLDTSSVLESAHKFNETVMHAQQSNNRIFHKWRSAVNKLFKPK